MRQSSYWREKLIDLAMKYRLGLRVGGCCVVVFYGWWGFARMWGRWGLMREGCVCHVKVVSVGVSEEFRGDGDGVSEVLRVEFANHWMMG